MVDLFSSVPNIKQKAVPEFFMHENEAAIGIHGQLQAVYGEDIVNISTVRCWVGKSRNFNESFDPKNQTLS